MSELGDRIVTEQIKKYYERIKASDIAPDKVEQREFGFGTIGTKVSARHFAFKDANALYDYVLRTIPAFVDYSAAYYKAPDARPMERKGWLGSELRFDLDASDPKFDCKIHEKSWLCEEKLDAVKRDTLLLIEDFLISDLGIEEKEISINFSGNRGYHVHVISNAVMQLDAAAREELCNYIKPQKIPATLFFPSLSQKKGQRSFSGPKPDDSGWYGKIARAFIEKLYAGQTALEELGISPSIAKRLFKEKELVEMGIRNGNWGLTHIPMDAIYWSNVVDKIVWEKSAYIDANVTKDPSHLMRLPNTIHGGSGFIAKKIQSISALEKFDPMKDAIAFTDGTVKVKVKTPYALRIGDSTYGPYSGEEVELPMYAGAYLYLKGFAEIINNS